MCTVSEVEEEEEEEVGIVLYLHHPVDVFHVVHMLVHIQITSSRLHQQIQQYIASSDKYRRSCTDYVHADCNQGLRNCVLITVRPDRMWSAESSSFGMERSCC